MDTGDGLICGHRGGVTLSVFTDICYRGTFVLTGVNLLVTNSHTGSLIHRYQPTTFGSKTFLGNTLMILSRPLSLSCRLGFRIFLPFYWLPRQLLLMAFTTHHSTLPYVKFRLTKVPPVPLLLLSILTGPPVCGVL